MCLKKEKKKHSDKTDDKRNNKTKEQKLQVEFQKRREKTQRHSFTVIKTDDKRNNKTKEQKLQVESSFASSSSLSLSLFSSSPARCFLLEEVLVFACLFLPLIALQTFLSVSFTDCI